MKISKACTLSLCVLLLFSATLSAQSLPPHDPLRILIVSDEVNPHGLSAAALTQPGDISTALLASSALNLATNTNGVLEIATDNLAVASAELVRDRSDALAYDVLIYFAHRIPSGASGASLQANFVAAVSQFLTLGGGVVSFHHGIYQTAGKESIQQLLGAAATGAVTFDQVNGQNVINLAPSHFITSHAINYSQSVNYQDLTNGIAANNYLMFNNTPDERYPTLTILPTTGWREFLFASNYIDNGATHVLGYTLHLPSWQGVVVMYQPGEYQPNALAAGNNNFQILLNMIFYVAQYSGVLFKDGLE